MASPAQPPTSQTTLPSLDDLKPSINASGDSGLIQAIATNDAFPASPANITVGQLSAQVAPGGQLKLPGVNNVAVGFSVSASANSALAAYQNPANLPSDLGFADSDGRQLNVSFPSDGKSRFLVVRWGFDLSGQVSGKMALDPAANITFGASGGTDGLFAFVRAVDPAMHARDAFLALLKAWCTPGAVANDASSLPPGCWVITEVTGQLSANLFLNAGYDFNWVKQVSLNDLEGDIGLRISLGLEAALTTQLASKFYLVLNRDSATSGVRLRLFRAKTKGWGFALNTGASVTTSTGSFLPQNLDDFVRAILGIHDAQLIKFLQASNLHDIANALGAEFLQNLRVDRDVNQAFTDLQNLLQKWDDLPHEVTTVIWNAAAKVPDLTAIQKVVQQIATLDENSIHNLLDSLLHNVSFYKTAVCQWLESAAGTGLFDLYESTNLAPVRQVATKVAGILDGSTVQNTLIKLKSQVDKAVNLPALESAVGNRDLTGVAVWVTQQLAKFLGIDLSNLKSNLAKIDTAIATIRAKPQEIYQATLKALNNTYGFSLAYAYNASNTQSALIDAQFADSAQSSLASPPSKEISVRFSQFANIPGRNMISAFLVYTALPGLNDFTFDGSTLKPNPKGDIVWDVRDPELATAVTQAFAGRPLRQNLSKIAALLAGIPQLKGSSQFYQDADAQILGFVLEDLQTTDPYITLLQNEKTVIDGAKKAFESFRQAGSKQLQQALPQFSTALVNLVTDFNRSLMSLSLDAPQVMRLFAPLVFGAAIDAMLAGAAPLPHDALMDVAVLKGTSLQDPAQPPSQGQIVLRQHVTSF